MKRKGGKGEDEKDGERGEWKGEEMARVKGREKVGKDKEVREKSNVEEIRKKGNFMVMKSKDKDS